MARLEMAVSDKNNKKIQSIKYIGIGYGPYLFFYEIKEETK